MTTDYKFKPFMHKVAYVYKKKEMQRRVVLSGSSNKNRLEQLRHLHNQVAKASAQYPLDEYYIELKHE